MAKALIFSGPAARPDWDKTNKSFTFQYVSGGASQEVTLAINPENYTQAEPSRITVTQTKGGAFVDNFGLGLKTITISGITGYKPRKASMSDEKISGHDHFIKLRKMYRDWVQQAKDNAKNTILRFYNWSDDEAYEIVINNFSLQRTVGRPLLYQYNIQITCLKDVAKPEREQDNITNVLVQARERASFVNQSLKNQTSLLDSIISGLGIENLSDSVKTWGKNVARGLEFFDTISSAYKTVASVLDGVKELNTDLNMFVDGTTAFIAQPYELVQNLTWSLYDISSQTSSLSDVPHDVVRALRNLICAIVALPQSLFVGFTNPSLFEGTSNCGTTLGIPEAAVSGFSNSFTATAQIPPQRSVSQVFNAPNLVITLKEDPLKVTGVFLETDVSRTGINYLDSYNSRQVTLSSVPSNPVVVDYMVKQESAQSMIQLEAAFSYIVKSGDTPVRIALKTLGDPTRWKEIVLFNGLDYPYIVEESDFQKEVFATGKVRFYRVSGSSGTITIPKGTSIYVPAYRGTNQIDFVTSEVAVLGLMETEIDVPIIAVHPGEIGNVASGFITGFTPITGIDRVSNIDTTTGGKIWQVALVGDLIQIPKTSKEATSAVVASVLSYESLFGVDIWVNEDGELDSSIESAKDLARVFGVDNLSQALINRIKTSKSFYPYYAEYGTNLPLYIGKKGTLNWYNLIKVDIKGSIMLDPRIQEIRYFKMEIDGDSVGMSFDAIPINEQSSLPLNLII